MENVENVETNSTGEESITTRVVENVEFVENFPVGDHQGRWYGGTGLFLLIASLAGAG